ncbi:uncharacterized protein MELLADRAFT_65040 [Melampsora larici-populina 98AG31]|uniref:Uncharacterized protein n=1 Tax=Melampsora larici-populina (strain 98AG31 / pathotype 3-4-7) TaxID=747676 RepID=F4RTS0_MELLP|nr:uncharacterized protein MELLADRAFT_65040 [Melampsora larici-populina 98AG31]EGG04052.1 hypothetical protein MELLADRAFT_65040 [Melampsora larici-populina 98AG31]
MRSSLIRYRFLKSKVPSNRSIPIPGPSTCPTTTQSIKTFLRSASNLITDPSILSIEYDRSVNESELDIESASSSSLPDPVPVESISSQLRNLLSPSPSTSPAKRSTPPRELAFLLPSALSPLLSTSTRDYLRYISELLSDPITPADQLWSELNRVHALGLFSHLAPEIFPHLFHHLPCDPEQIRWKRGGELNQPKKIEQIHLRIIFLLDRLAERKSNSLEGSLPSTFKLSICRTAILEHYASLGFYRGGSLVWDILNDNGLPAPTATDQVLLLYCIRQNMIGLSWPDERPSKPYGTSPSTSTSLPQADSGSPKEIERMIDRAIQIATQLLSEPTTLGTKAESLIIRWSTEILACASQVDKLEDWLRTQLGIELRYPDSGSHWLDGSITSAVIRMWRSQGELGKMITFYQAAVEPSKEMKARLEKKNNDLNFFSSVPHSIPIPTTGEEVIQEKPVEKIEYVTELPITTRTYHDLITACVQSDRIHLALHYLTQAIERTEAYVTHLSTIPTNTKTKPPKPPLRLQPDTYQILIRHLCRKRRNTQLQTVQALSRRLLESIVKEIEWYHLHSKHLSEISSQGDQWDGLLENIIPKNQTEDQIQEGYRGLEIEVFKPRFEIERIYQSKALDLTSTNLKVSKERISFLGKTLRHTIKLNERLNTMILRVKEARQIRWELSQLNSIQKKVKEVEEEGQKGRFEKKLKKCQDRIDRMVKERMKDSEVFGYGQERNVFGRTKRRIWSAKQEF